LLTISIGNPAAAAPGNTPAVWPVPGSSSSGIVSSESDSVPEPDPSPLGSVMDAVALSNSVHSGIVTTCYRTNTNNVVAITHPYIHKHTHTYTHTHTPENCKKDYYLQV
jgi:hypothetical protein